MFIADNSIFKSIMQYFFSARSIAPKEFYLMMNLEKKIHFTVFKISVKMQIDGQTLIKCDFLEGRLPKYFFQEICFSGSKHKVSAAFIVKNCHPRTSLISLLSIVISFVYEDKWWFDESMSATFCIENSFKIILLFSLHINSSLN